MITPPVLEKILSFLAPLFLDTAKGDPTAARDAASAILGSYEARTDRELRLAALAIAFGFGALDALSRASDKNLPVNQVLRLRGNANALSRAALQNEARLEKARRQPAATEPPTDAPLPDTTEPQDLAAFVRAAWKAEKAAKTATAQPAPQPQSRQQRRFAERQAEKQRQREQEQARLAQRAAQRTILHAEASPSA